MFSIWISGKTGTQRLTHDGGPLEFGRGPRLNVPRHVLTDPTVSNNQLRIDPQNDGGLLLTNLSQRVHVRMADGSIVPPGGELTIRPPVRLHVGETLIEIGTPVDDSKDEAGKLRTIEPPVEATSWNRTVVLEHLGRDPNAAEIARWFEALVSIQKAAASSPDFFTDVARAVVELIGLDRGLVLLHSGRKWVPTAVYSPGSTFDESDYSDSILNTVLRERRTFYQELMPSSSSLVGVSAVVASPILNEHQEVIGAVYGARLSREGVMEIRPIEAQLTQVLAAAVAAGLARLDGEAEAARRRVQFEQFFTPDLAGELDRDPSLLDGRERDITALFADIRGFSSVSERVAPRVACDFIRDVMECLTTQARAHGGVVVDYQGDGLLAMWNAPMDQPDHATRACRAALAMRGQLPALNARWRERVGRSVGLGIGINTGPALVGNTGSRSKFKYGPLGHSVNLASRVEGATKQVGVPVLITGGTKQALDAALPTRRLCAVRVVGMGEPVQLYELMDAAADVRWQAKRDAYEHALELFEARHWADACHALFPLLPGRDDTSAEGLDAPSLSLFARTLECLKAPPVAFDPVVELAVK